MVTETTQIEKRTNENDYESDTNSSIRRTRSPSASGNAASRTGCERSSHQGSRRLGQSGRLENAGRLHEGFSSALFAGHAWVGCFRNGGRSWPRYGSIQTGRRSVREPGAGRRRVRGIRRGQGNDHCRETQHVGSRARGGRPGGGPDGMAGAV